MKKIFLILVVITVVFANTDRSIKRYIQTHQHEKKVALVIGNSDYSKFPKLPNALNDAKDVRDALKKMGFIVIYGQNLTRKEIIKKLRKFDNQLNHKSIALFYYAGHGLEVKNTNYVLPLKADIETKIDVSYEAVSLNRVVDEMKVARLKIVVIDACRNNPFGRGVEKTTFAPLNADGTILAFGTSSGDEASENSNDRNGLFTKYFLQTLNKPNLNQRDFFAEIRREVYLNSNKEQKPAFYDETIGNFYFNIDTSKLKHKKVISNTQKPDEILWNKIKNSKNIEDYKFFIKLYPNSAYVSLAKFSIVKLNSKTTKSQITTQNDKVWVDPDTGLMWQVKISTKKYTWWDAKKYCSNLDYTGYNDWRLPNLKELETILTKNYYYSKSFTHKAYIKKSLLKSIYNLNKPVFWSNSPNVSFLKIAWIVYFYNGSDNKDYRTNTYYVRCVRGNLLKQDKINNKKDILKFVKDAMKMAYLRNDKAFLLTSERGRIITEKKLKRYKEREMKNHRRFFEHNFPFIKKLSLKDIDNISIYKIGEVEKFKCENKVGKEVSCEKRKVYIKHPNVTFYNDGKITIYQIENKLYWVPFGW